ncbi:sugar porter family MFS transporter [Alicyclobacillus cycloheptanicus]|uniref:SP family arabinose:H+ symporter-like MFS transporter n=2 Tax=Alicyclobacillus cycloheptanicus TaxID=1457 RepID=A0ABT9XHJ2_9BACL|nr:sugar porter family MFS transporter [Alicyclobacillus cycloheptanicus]MDQ0189779.1 SP family arabinose:H+ symporter-like MFS transporter [Alicyclobacillus cycloheptanicus]
MSAQATSVPAEQDTGSALFVTLVTCVAAIGGFLFGYDQGVISGAIGYLQTDFHLSAGLMGFVSASIPLGAMAGVILAGVVSDRAGRKPVLLLAGLLFVVSSLGCAAAHSVAMLVVFRLIGGLGIGVASMVSPMYISEISPARIRGRLVGTNQLGVVLGILIVYIVNAVIANEHTASWDQLSGWRWMFGVGAVPGILFFILLFGVPESPRFLVKQGKAEHALSILQRINGASVARTELSSITASLQREFTERGVVGELFKKGLRVALLVAVVLAVMQQFTGVSAVAYYAPIIFKDSGAGANAALIETVFIGALKVIFTIVLMLLIDRVGRRTLLLVGASAMAVFLIALGVSFAMAHVSVGLVLACILLHTIAFELSWGGGVWIVISEIFPTRIRGQAMAIGSFALWGATYLVTQFFPVMMHHFGATITFFIFALMCILMFLFTLRFLPETKGKTLEEIQTHWHSYGDNLYTSM